jgi:hypothetical protein
MAVNASGVSQTPLRNSVLTKNWMAKNPSPGKREDSPKGRPKMPERSPAVVAVSGGAYILASPASPADDSDTESEGSLSEDDASLAILNRLVGMGWRSSSRQPREDAAPDGVSAADAAESRRAEPAAEAAPEETLAQSSVDEAAAAAEREKRRRAAILARVFSLGLC